jgi:uncharacterized membrane protein YfcA
MFFPNAEVAVNPVLLVLLGVMVGTLSGFFGVGGGFLITGGLLVFGVPTVFAVGTGLTLIMGSSLINTLKHRDLGHVDFKLGLLMVIGTIPALFLSERLNTALESAGVVGPVIRYTYVVILAALGLFIVYDYWRMRRRISSQQGEVTTIRLVHLVQSLRIPPHSVKIPGLWQVPMYISLPVSEIQRISIWVPIVIGIGVGFLAGLLGAGGGFILMPILVYVLGIPTTAAIGTDLFQIIITGSVGTLLYSLSNHVDLLMAMIMLAAASLGAQLGSTATKFVEAARIRILYGLTVLSGSIAVALKQVAEAGPGLGFLSTVATIVLLSVSGAMCVVIAVLLVAAHGHVSEVSDKITKTQRARR